MSVPVARASYDYLLMAERPVFDNARINGRFGHDVSSDERADRKWSRVWVR